MDTPCGNSTLLLAECRERILSAPEVLEQPPEDAELVGVRSGVCLFTNHRLVNSASDGPGDFVLVLRILRVDGCAVFLEAEMKEIS